MSDKLNQVTKIPSFKFQPYPTIFKIDDNNKIFDKFLGGLVFMVRRKLPIETSTEINFTQWRKITQKYNKLNDKITI